MPRIVYLAGSMEGRTLEEMNVWRLRAVEVLRAHGFAVLSPVRNKEEEIKKMRRLTTKNVERKFKTNEIVKRDLNDIDRSDIILMELNDSPDHLWHHIGTLMEAGSVIEKRHMVVVVTNSEIVKHHPWVKYMAESIHSDLEEALDHIVKYIGSE